MRHACPPSRPWAAICPVLKLACLASVLAADPPELGAASPGEVSFNFQVRPVLSDRCFACHGPDEKSRKGKLRLDTPEGAHQVLAQAQGLKPFAPGSLEKSAAWQRITSHDPDQQMPPPASRLSLNAEEVSLIKRWIEQGATYERHWAFEAVQPVFVPKAAGLGEVRNEIDAFVLDRLRREGLQPAPEASRERLLRRLSLDLTGLPPSLEEQDAFLADASTNAFPAAVDRLLASPHYGERMAQDWMDLARYADTYGYQSDVERDLSPWRDWVIRAFNQNLRFDEFLRWQIAGDLLPGATREQRLATAFNRLHRQTNEGGSIEEEFRNEYVSDRVNTLGTAVLGLTLECARCHDHKYDPVTQRDYYRLAAFFNSIDESGLYSHFTRATPTPAMPLYEGDQEQRHQALRAQIASQEAALAALLQAATNAPDGLEVKAPAPVATLAFESISSNRVENAIASSRPAVLHDGPELAEGRIGRALRFSGDNEVVCKGTGEFNRTDPFSFSLWLNPAETHERAVVFHRSRAWTDSGSRGYELLLENGRPSFALIHFWPGNALRVLASAPLPTNVWSHLVVTYDGSSRAAGLKLFRNGEPLGHEVVRDRLTRDITHRAEWGDAEAGNVHLTLAGRFRDSGFRQGRMDEFQVFNTRLTTAEVRQLHHAQAGPSAAPSRLSPADLQEHFALRANPAVQSKVEELKRLRAAENLLANDLREIMVMDEMAPPRAAHLLGRGAYDAPGERVERGTPESIFAFSEQLPRSRLGLAQWLTDQRNPLVARVAVNRIWQMHFGRGLVATPEDFGGQGSLPTHPELLDWLAGWFMDYGWDVKALHRLIVSSATYRQSSTATKELLARDPDNTLLARGPKHRLSAEQIRDSALAVSGLLNPQIGGPSVKPYQPAGLWEESGTGKTYTQDHGDKLHRRSLYTFWRRTAPPPAMLTFDATSREVCTAKRETTMTPLQALVLLNDPQFIEAGRVLGERLWIEAGGDTNRLVTAAFRLATGRVPQPREREILSRLYAEQHAEFAANPDLAGKYLSIGEAARDKTLPAADAAAAAVVACAVLNHDEFVMQR
jgi:hypothetical protein